MKLIGCLVLCVSSLALGFLAHAHGVGPWGRALDWHNDQIDQVIAFGGSGRKVQVAGRDCLVGTRLNFKVNDEFAFDIDETVWLDIAVELGASAVDLSVSYDGDGPRESLFEGRLTKATLPKAMNGQRHVQTLVLEHARFGNLGFEGSDFSINADGELTICELSLRRSHTTPIVEAFGRMALEVRDEGGGKLTAARVGIYSDSGRFPLPSEDALLLRNSLTGASRVMNLAGIGQSLPPWPAKNRTVFYVNGQYGARLPAGEYELIVAKGPEHRLARERFSVEENRTTLVRIRLQRWRDMAREGWYSGEDHMHYARHSPHDDRLLGLFAQAEYIKVSNILQFDNSHTSYLQHYDWKTVIADAETSTVLVPGQEAPRTTRLGHTIQLNTKKPIRDTSTYLLYHKAFEAARAQGGLAGYAHAVGPQFDPETYRVKGMAIDVPLGSVDFAEIMTLHVTGTSVWFDFLNLGFKISPTAGTDYPFGGVPGTARNYVKLDSPFTSQAWFDALKKGHTFITSGPMLEFSINGRRMGSEIQANPGETLSIEGVATINPDMGRVASLELVEQGDVIRTVPGLDEGSDVELRHEVRAKQGTWFVLQARGVNPDMVAISAPIYVRVDGQSFWKPSAVPEIVSKLKSRMLEILSPDAPETTEAYEAQKPFSKYWEEQKDLLKQRVDQANAVYDDLLARATAGTSGHE